MTAVTWGPDGGRLNSYRAAIGRRNWTLTLTAAGWFLMDASRAVSDIFVASERADTDTAQARAVAKARNVT